MMAKMQGVALATFFVHHMYKSFMYTSAKICYFKHLVAFTSYTLNNLWTELVFVALFFYYYLCTRHSAMQKNLALTNTILAAVKSGNPVAASYKRSGTLTKQ